jgi:hypothetical protein
MQSLMPPEVTRVAANAPTGGSGVEPPARERNMPTNTGPALLTASAPVTAIRTVTIIDGTSGKQREIAIPETSNVIGFNQQLPDPPLRTAAALGSSAPALARSLPAR